MALALICALLATVSARAPPLPIPRLDALPLPAPLLVPPFRGLAAAYVDAALNASGVGPLLPIAWRDATSGNAPRWVLGLPSYIGAASAGAAHEALSGVGSVLTAALVGRNVSALFVPGLGEIDAYAQLAAYFAAAKGSDVFSNNDDNAGSAEWWYALWPTASVFMAASVAASPALDGLLLRAALAWRVVVRSLPRTPMDAPSFNSTGFNFDGSGPGRGAPFFNGEIVEHDAAAGAAFIFLQAAARFGDASFLDDAHAALDYLDGLPPSTTVLYELLAPLGAYAAARLAAEAGAGGAAPRTHDLPQLLAWATAPSAPAPLSRPDWGVLDGVWGEPGVRVCGLVGSTSDSLGYGFALNTFTTAATLLPVARYNSSYAAPLARLGLCAASSARFFFRAFSPPALQDDYAWSAQYDPGGGIAYEGVRAFGPARPPYTVPGPYATGDEIREGGRSNLALYGGAWVGLFAALVVPTNVTAVPAFDLCATDAHGAPAWPTSLAMNPTVSAVAVAMPAPAGAAAGTLVDVYDSVVQAWVVRGVPAVEAIVLALAPQQAAVVVRVPAGAPVELRGRVLFAGGRAIDYDYTTA